MKSFRKLPFEASDVGPPTAEATTLLMKRFSHQTSSLPHQFVVRRDDNAIPACSGWGTNLSNKSLRIASIFIIFACSMFGVFLPMLLARTSPNWRYSKISFFVFKYFGSGVILATAFMHLLSPAVEALSDACLNGILPAYDWGHSICLMTIMIMFYIELMAARFNFGFGHSHGPATSPSDITGGHSHSKSHSHAHAKAHSPAPVMSEWPSANNSAVSGLDGSNGIMSRSNLNFQVDIETATSSGRVSPTTDGSLNKKEITTAGVASASPSPLLLPSPKPADALPSLPSASTTSQHNGGLPAHLAYPPGNQDHLAHGHDHVNGDSHASYSSQIVSLLILEFGVVFHSLFIGLSLAGSDNFTVLLIVIAFHQFFEGLGLGSRLAVATWPSDWKTWTGYLMATGYGFTTPIGIAIGLGVNEGLNSHPATAQLVNGVFDAVSSGILIYTALVELLAHEFMFNPEMRDAKLSVQMLAFLCVAVGVSLMSLLAKWA